MTKYIVEKTSDLKGLSRLASQLIASYIDLALDQRERCQIALSGGSTPKETYRLLSKEHLPWNRVDIFLADERWVDINHEDSNSRLIRETLLSNSPASEATFHAIPTTDLSTPSESADAYENKIKTICGGNPPIFDLVLLGLGEDGHTASLFPKTNSLEVKDRFITTSEGNSMNRITLTSPVLCSARKILFLVSGSNKGQALKRMLDSAESPYRTPAKLVRPDSEITVLADKAAVESI